MDGRVWLVFLALFVGGCGEEPPEDRTPALIRCFVQHGGQRVTRVSQQFPSADPQYGTGFSLESISFDSIDVDAGGSDVRQALVFVYRPFVGHGHRSYSASEGLQRARRGDDEVVAMIVMPAVEEWDTPLNDCAEAVAREQIYP